MSGVKKKAWFHRVGPFGGIFPVSLCGFVYLFLYVSLVLFLCLYAKSIEEMGGIEKAGPYWLGAIVSGVVGYVLALAKSK